MVGILCRWTGTSFVPLYILFFLFHFWEDNLELFGPLTKTVSVLDFENSNSYSHPHKCVGALLQNYRWCSLFLANTKLSL